MPLPKDERVVALANDLLAQFDQIFGVHSGFRAAHAKGLLLTGTFTPASGAQSLTKAPHVVRESTPVTARFSNSTGLPQIPDNKPEANPRGLAIRFNLAEHEHTDIVSHSTDGFPTRDGYEFLEFLKAASASGPDVPSPKPIETFLGSHPSALAFVQAPKPFPKSFARQTYFGVTAFVFTNSKGQTRFGRYRIVPEEGNDFFSDEAAARLSPDYHFEEIMGHLKKDAVRFRIMVQLAEEGDIVDDATRALAGITRTLQPGDSGVDGSGRRQSSPAAAHHLRPDTQGGRHRAVGRSASRIARSHLFAERQAKACGQNGRAGLALSGSPPAEEFFGRRERRNGIV